MLFQAKSRVKEVYSQTCRLLSQQGMRDCELFGLAILSGEYISVQSLHHDWARRVIIVMDVRKFVACARF